MWPCIGELHCFLQLFPSFQGIKSGSFDLCEGDALMAHQMTTLISQSVACSLLMSHFGIPWNPTGVGAKNKVRGIGYYHLMENHEKCAKPTEEVLMERGSSCNWRWAIKLRDDYKNRCMCAGGAWHILSQVVYLKCNNRSIFSQNTEGHDIPYCTIYCAVPHSI